MIERIKTVVLVVLVAASLIQSYVLAYSTPNFERVTQSDYVETEPNGTQAELADIIKPDQIILHFGQKTHTVLRPEDAFYNMILTQLLKRRTFDGFRRTNPVSNMNWESIRNEHQGIEVRFKAGLPISVLKSLVQIKEDVPVDNDLITKMWIFSGNNKDEVKTYFFTDTSTIYEAVKADVTVLDIENKVALGSYLPTYHSDNGDYYLPDSPISTVRIKLPYTVLPADKLKQSFFVDPDLTRFLLDRDGTQIYTDGKRGLQIQSDKRWMSYTDPVYAQTDNKVDTKDYLVSALQFVNQHGGWNGTFTYSQGNMRVFGGGPQTYLFRMQVEGLPVVNSTFGFIRMAMQKGTVSSFERTLVIPETKGMTKTAFTLPGGKDIDQMVESYGRRSQIVSVYPAYRSLLSDQLIDLMPMWAVELRDGTIEFLQPG